MKSAKAIAASAIAVLGLSNAWADTNLSSAEQCSDFVAGISYYSNQDAQDYMENGNNHHLICYKQVCNEEEFSYCGAELPFDVKYTLTTDIEASDPTKVIISEDEFAANPNQFGGAINISNPGQPIINKFNLRDYLEPGLYYLTIKINSLTKSIRILIASPETTSGISYTTKNDVEDYALNGNNHIKLSYIQTNGTTTEEFSGSEIPYNITYTLTKDQTATDSTQALISEEEFAVKPIQMGGAIDVSSKGMPVINIEKLRDFVAPGLYYLVVEINSNKKAIQMKVADQSARVKEETMSIANSVSAKTNFSISTVKSLEISICTNTLQQGAAKQFAVMDMKGQVISAGHLNSSETHVKVPTSGSYIVKVGQESKRINIK